LYTRNQYTKNLRASPFNTEKLSPSFSLLIGFLIYLISVFPTLTYAAPTGGTVTSGSGTITDDGSGNITVNQTSDQIVINWESFGINTNQTVTFVQPDSASSALNNVTGLDPSVIAGALIANGQVFLVNTNGIIISSTANIDVGSLVMSTLNISDQDFLDKLYKFTQDPDKALGLILNQGTMRAADFVAMVAPGIKNEGVVIANLGTVALASGEAATLDFVGDGLIKFVVEQAVDGTVLDADGNTVNDRISNTGTLQADGGQVMLTAFNASNAIQNVINMEGYIQANTVLEKGGEVYLVGNGPGVVNVSGSIKASGDDTGEAGGTVHVLGEKVGLFDTASIDVSGDTGGGTALIGGDFQGKNPEIQNAYRTFVGTETTILADALTSGDGGKVILWADDVTRYYGSISATGGTVSGDGGFVEVSGKGNLVYEGSTNVGATNGVGGTLLLDPTNIIVSTAAQDPSDITGTFDPGADNTLAFADESGTTTLNIGSSFSGIGNDGVIKLQANGTITISDAWNINTSTGNTGVSVTLQAGGTITINGAITLDNGGSLLVVAGDALGTQDRDANLDINEALTTVNGNITLSSVNNITFAAAGDVTITGSGSELAISADTDRTEDNFAYFGGAVTMDADTVIDAGSGLIEIDSTGDMKIGRLITLNTTNHESDGFENGVEVFNYAIDIVINGVGSGGIIDAGVTGDCSSAGTGGCNIVVEDGGLAILANGALGGEGEIDTSGIETTAGALGIAAAGIDIKTFNGDINIIESGVTEIFLLQHDGTGDIILSFESSSTDTLVGDTANTKLNFGTGYLINRTPVSGDGTTVIQGTEEDSGTATFDSELSDILAIGTGGC
jgi:filamentous hemagglutinin family protein